MRKKPATRGNAEMNLLHLEQNLPAHAGGNFDHEISDRMAATIQR